MKWLITGGCGFIGVNLVRKLLEDGNNYIRIVDDLSEGNKDILAEITDFEEIEKPKEFSKQVQLIVADIRDFERAVEVSKDMEIVVHLAANTGVMPSIKDPFRDMRMNVEGTFNYLEACRTNGVKKFLYASSGAALGEHEPPIHEQKLPKPVSPYGASKLCGESYCHAYHGTFGLTTVMLRFSNVYGPYADHKVSAVHKFIKNTIDGKPCSVYGDGEQTRDFVFVEDIVDAIVKSSKLENCSEPFNLATNRETSVNQIIEIINEVSKEKLGREIQVNYEEGLKGEVRRTSADMTKAKNMLGWEPKVNVEEGIRKTFDYFMN